MLFSSMGLFFCNFIKIALGVPYNKRNIFKILLTSDLKVKRSSSVIRSKLNTPLQ